MADKDTDLVKIAVRIADDPAPQVRHRYQDQAEQSAVQQ